MTELKTLKDITLKGSTMSIAWNYATIREEAIKWVKSQIQWTGRNAIIDSWMQFFNITSGDLK